MQGTPMDPKFGRLMKFAENFKTRTKTSSLSNLYIIQAIDSDGNVVDEKYLAHEFEELLYKRTGGHHEKI